MCAFELEKVLASLSQHKPVFHFEKDMQAAFAEFNGHKITAAYAVFITNDREYQK